MDSLPPKKSLRRPVDNLPMELSSAYVFGEDLDTLLSAYVQHPHRDTLNEAMLNYADMESVLKLYNDHTFPYFESRLALDILSQRFDLPPVKDFNDLLKNYDCKYATVRSYHHKNRTPKKILVQAAREGNIQAVVNGLKMYPELRVQKVYSKAAVAAVREGHEAILEMFLELGIKNYKRLSLAAAQGGHLTLIKRLRELDDTKPCLRMFRGAATGSHVEVLDYLLFLIGPIHVVSRWNISFGAGRSGSMEMVKYGIEKGGNINRSLLGAARGGHLELVKKLVSETNALAHHEVMSEAIRGGHLEVVKYFVEELQQMPEAARGIEEAARFAKVDIFFYFVGKGVDVTDVNLLVSTAEGGNVQIMEFLLQQPRTTNDLITALKKALWRLQKRRKVFQLLAQRLEVQGPVELQEAIRLPFYIGVGSACQKTTQTLAPYMNTDDLNSAKEGEVNDCLIKIFASCVGM